MVWSPKTKAKRNLVNDLIWRKNTLNINIWLYASHSRISSCPNMWIILKNLFLSKTLLKDSTTYWLFQTPANTFLMFSFFFLCECQIRLCRFSWAFGGMYIQSHFKRVMMYQQLLLEPNSEKNTLVSLERPKD